MIKKFIVCIIILGSIALHAKTFNVNCNAYYNEQGYINSCTIINQKKHGVFEPRDIAIITAEEYKNNKKVRTIYLSNKKVLPVLMQIDPDVDKIVFSLDSEDLSYRAKNVIIKLNPRKINLCNGFNIIAYHQPNKNINNNKWKLGKLAVNLVCNNLDSD